jgi:hypothetical protein
MIPPVLTLQGRVGAVQSGMERVGEEVSKLLPQGLQVEVFRVPCLGRVRFRLVVKSGVQSDSLLSATCSMYIVMMMVDKTEDT